MDGPIIDPHSRESGIVENQQVGSLGWQPAENVFSGQCDECPLELSRGQCRKGERGNGFQDWREHGGHPRGKSGTCEGEDGVKGALRNGLKDRRRNESRNIWVEGL